MGRDMVTLLDEVPFTSSIDRAVQLPIVPHGVIDLSLYNGI